MTGLQPRSGENDALTERLLWFRADHPDASIETELVVAEEEMAVCRATLRTTEAGEASSHGSALREQVGPTYVEIAENRALSRALILLGYSGSPEDDVASAPVAPVETGDVEVDEEPEAPPPIPPELVPARTLLQEAPAPGYEPDSESGGQPQASGEDGDDGADVSWNKFWRWARQRGYTSARQLNEMLGVDNVLAYTPGEVRQMVVKYELDSPPGDREE